MLAQEITHWSSISYSATSCPTFSGSPLSMPEYFSSIFRFSRPLAYSMTSARAGILSPANSFPNQDPPSNFWISSNVRSLTLLFTPATRSKVVSWHRTTTPSAVSCTSISAQSAISSTAASRAAMVFSGAEDELPLWAVISVRAATELARNVPFIPASIRPSPPIRPHAASAARPFFLLIMASPV